MENVAKFKEIKENYANAGSLISFVGFRKHLVLGSPFSISALLWSLKNRDYQLSLIHEYRGDDSSEILSYDFVIFDIKPYINYLINTDMRDRKIIENIWDKDIYITELAPLLISNIEKEQHIPYRTLYDRIKKLQALGILNIEKNRRLKLHVNDQLKKMFGLI